MNAYWLMGTFTHAWGAKWRCRSFWQSRRNEREEIQEVLLSALTLLYRASYFLSSAQNVHITIRKVLSVPVELANIMALVTASDVWSADTGSLSKSVSPESHASRLQRLMTHSVEMLFKLRIKTPLPTSHLSLQEMTANESGSRKGTTCKTSLRS